MADRIDELLNELVTCQDEVTHHLEVGDRPAMDGHSAGAMPLGSR